MTFVEDYQPKSIAPALQVDVGRIVGRHRQGLDVVVAATH